MAKPDPALLDPARYPFQLDIPTRFGDLDMNQHINNAAMAGLFEDARVRFLYRTGAMGGPGAAQPMAASFAIEYLQQAYYPAPLTFHVGVSHIGRTSHTIVHLATQGDTTVTLAHSVVVATQDGRPCALPADVEAVTRQWMLR